MKALAQIKEFGNLLEWTETKMLEVAARFIDQAHSDQRVSLDSFLLYVEEVDYSNSPPSGKYSPSKEW